MQKTYRMAEYETPHGFPFHMGGAHVEGEFAVHAHDFAELVVVFGGTADHEVDGKNYRIGVGDVYVLNTGAQHAFHDARDLNLVNVMYTPEMLKGVGPDVRCLSGFQALFVISSSPSAEFRCTMHLDNEMLQEVRRMLNMMLVEFEAKQSGFGSVLRAQFAQLVVFLSRSYSRSGVRVRGPKSGLRLAETVGYLQDHCTEELSLEGLAQRSGLSRRHFVRLFRALYGTTPVQYLLSLRLDRAAGFLRTTDMRITEIAFACGFTDSNYFTRLFRNRIGMPPRQYRRRSI
jgi:AraC family L-rhamnose operon regulatory protein RhaS